MIVNTAIFTCSICGEASSNICAYCTKDACSNHRCERCKRCSDCCECEFPLSAEEPALPQAEPVTAAVEEKPALPEMRSHGPIVLTAAESAVFVEGSVPAELIETGSNESVDEDISTAVDDSDESKELRLDTDR